MNPILAHTLETVSVGRPITRAGISLFPIYLHQEPSPLPYVAGSSAMVSGALRIEETQGGVVSELELVSDVEDPVLLPAGDTVVGGLQNRTINVSILIEAKFRGPIPVSCVEAGRWGRHRSFAPGEAFAPRRVRRSMTRSVSESLISSGSRFSDQVEVWGTVDADLDRAGVTSATRAIHDARRQIEPQLKELAEMGPLPQQAGVVASMGHRVIAADIFERPDILSTYWRPIVHSLMFDAQAPTPGKPSVSAVLRFLRRIGTGESVSVEGASLGVEHRISHPRVEAQALTLDRTILHLSAFAT